MTISIVQLVIFDCEVVLVDSEHLSNRVFADMLSDSLFYIFENL